ncbi:MAG: ABC transporter, ATP-binding protein, partial [uncultured Nocardioides sp.]
GRRPATGGAHRGRRPGPATGELADDRPRGPPGRRRGARPRPRRDLPGRRERQRQVHAGGGRGGRLRPLPGGRHPSRPPLDATQRVAAGPGPAAAARARLGPVGLLPAGRDHARLVHLPRAEPRLPRPGLPRDEPRRVVPQRAGDPLRLPRLLLPRRAGGRPVVHLHPQPGRHAAGAGGRRQPGAVRHPLPRARRAAGRPDPRGRRVGPARDRVGGPGRRRPLAPLPEQPAGLPAAPGL